MSVANRARTQGLRRVLEGRAPLGPVRQAATASSSSSSSLPRLSSCSSAGRPGHQRRWAQVHDVRFLVTTHAPRRVLERYRDKLDRKARDEGHDGIEGLKQAYSDQIRAQRRRDAVAVPGLDAILGADEDAARVQTSRQQHPPAAKPGPPPSLQQHPASESSPGTSLSRAGESKPQTSQVKPLSAILDLPKARELPVPELSAVWRLRHASSPRSLCAVLPASTYAAMETLARARPHFVLPVPHPSQGAEVHFLQWTFDAASRTSTVLFTQLAEFKARGEFAQPHTTITHHADLAADKGVVLMQGAVVENRGVSVADAQFLVMCLQRFYGGWDVAASSSPQDQDLAATAATVADGRAAERRRLLEWFSTGDARFTVEKLLEETERLA